MRLRTITASRGTPRKGNTAVNRSQWHDALMIALTAWGFAARVGLAVPGVKAVSRARTRNRLEQAGFLTIYLEPSAFSGDAARFRRLHLCWMSVFLAIFSSAWLVQWIFGG